MVSCGMDKTQENRIVIRSVDVDETKRLWQIVDRLGYAKDRDYFDRCLELQQEGKRQILMAEIGGEGCAYCILNWAPKYGLYKKLGIAEIQDVNVVQEKREQGVATALIAHCEDLARQKGHKEIGISVGVHESYGPAQRLYFKLGYGPDGAGATYDRQPVAFGDSRPVDDDLCLMLLKDLQSP